MKNIDNFYLFVEENFGLRPNGINGFIIIFLLFIFAYFFTYISSVIFLQFLFLYLLMFVVLFAIIKKSNQPFLSSAKVISIEKIKKDAPQINSYLMQLNFSSNNNLYTGVYKKLNLVAAFSTYSRRSVGLINSLVIIFPNATGVTPEFPLYSKKKMSNVLGASLSKSLYKLEFLIDGNKKELVFNIPLDKIESKEDLVSVLDIGYLLNSRK